MTTATDCEAKTCTYYRHYLKRGPADLTHEGYHAVEKAAEDTYQRWNRHFANCPKCDVGMQCQVSDILDREAAICERRIRA